MRRCGRRNAGGSRCGRGVGEVALDLRLEARLIVLDRQEIVAAGIDDRRGDGGIAGDGVDGDERAREREPFQQRRDRLGLARLVGHRLLAENQALAAGPGRDQVQRLAVAAAIMAATRGLAVDGD